MKSLFILLVALFGTITMYSQGGEYVDNELNIQIQNAFNRTIVFEMIPIGPNWAKIISGCTLSVYNDQTTYVSSLHGYDTNVVCEWNGFQYRFNFQGNYTVINNCAQPTAGLKPIRNGFYRVNIRENNILKAYAYFDWRDLGFTSGCNTCPSGNDFTIRYDALNDYLMFWNKGPVPITNQNPNLYLTNGQIVTWGEWQCNIRSFEQFWSNGLLVIKDVSGHPQLVWGPYSNSSNLSYLIEKKVNYGNWEALTTITATQYTDNSVYIAPEPGSLISYRITAKINGVPQVPTTNVVTVAVYNIEKNSAEVIMNNEYDLRNNYPNPFNPTTRISYSLQEEGLVTIKVFDVLGNEVAELVNEMKPEGYYEVEFNANNLPSGMYLYKLEVGKFTSVKKMLLVR